MSAAPSQLYPATQLAAIINLLHRMALRAPALPQGMTASQLSTIAFLRFSQGPLYQRDLEAFFKLRRSTVSSQLNTLERKGLLRRVPVSHDARLKQLVLTDEGERIGTQVLACLERMNQRMTQGMTQDEIALLTQLLGKVEENLGRAVP